jgi:hypothetical protein
MNWAKYLVNQLEIDYREAQDQGHEFHFSWLLILIAFVAWELLEGATFPDFDPFEPLVVKFSTLWYSMDMSKQWKSNAIFHKYYNQLKTAIGGEPRIALNTLQRFWPLIKFSVDHHFIYLTPRTDEHQEQLQFYYKLTEEDLEEITKEWSADLLVLANPTDISNIDIPEAVQDTPRPSKMKKTKKTKETKKTEEVQDVDSYSVKTASITPDQEDNNDDLEEVEQQPEEEVEVLKKRKGSPSKSSSKKKEKATVTKMKTMLNPDDFKFLLATLNEAIE